MDVIFTLVGTLPKVIAEYYGAKYINIFNPWVNYLVQFLAALSRFVAIKIPFNEM